MVYFSKFAEEKFFVLARHRVRVARTTVERIMEAPEHRRKTGDNLFFVDGPTVRQRALRVAYVEEKEGMRRVITFYPVFKE